MEKIAIINSVYEYGSTGALAKQLYEYGIEQGYEIFVFYGRGERINNNHIIKIDSKIEVYIHKLMTLLTGYQGYFSNYATKKLIKYLDDKKIQKVILLNVHGYYLNEKKLLNFLKNKRIKTVYVTPDEYAGLGKCCYSNGCDKYITECGKCPQKKDYPKSIFFDRSKAIFKMKLDLYNHFDTMILIGPEANLIKFRQSALVKNKPMKKVSWGIDLNKYKYEIDDSLYEKYDIPRDKIIVLTVANYSNPRKGVKEYFFEIAKRMQDSNYFFINVGYDGDLKDNEIPKNLRTIGYINDQLELAHLYSISDLYFLASSTDTMPISCLISFACETPVCCFYVSGLKFLAPKECEAIRYCDEISVEAMKKVVENTKKKEKRIMNACRKLAEEEYSIEQFNRKTYLALEEI